MHVLVLAGGPSNEREVSLVSGRAIAEGLRAAGHDVTLGDVAPRNFDVLDDLFDVVFPALHGAFGEDGVLQAEFERRGIAFVGSGSVASALGFDKARTKAVWRAHGLPVPADGQNVPPPCVVKPNAGGSSLGITMCQSVEQRDTALAADPTAICEQLIVGPEWTVGILDDQPLPPIRIDTGDSWFDYESKYAEDGAPHCFELNAPAELVERVMAMSLEAHRLIGARHLSRVDLMLDESGEPYLLEINTMPGFTPRSLLPDAARYAGIEFPELVDRLVRMAVS
ncbi:MAG: D-alanine--D-alanine ligase [Planctomycetota bacterium]